MIELIRREHDPEADWVEAGLRELVLGYRRTVLSDAGAGKLSLPVLRHGEQVYQGRQGLLDGLHALERLAEDWRRFQSDACYVDEDGSGCR